MQLNRINFWKAAKIIAHIFLTAQITRRHELIDLKDQMKELRVPNNFFESKYNDAKKQLEDGDAAETLDEEEQEGIEMQPDDAILKERQHQNKFSDE